MRVAAWLAILATGAVSGCGGDESAGAPVPFDKNRQQWALPLDQFGQVDAEATQYAQNLLVARCMEKHGFAWPIPPYKPGEPPTATWNRAGRRLFNVPIAQRYGYRLAPQRDPAAIALAIELNSRQLEPTEEAAKNDCVEEMNIELPMPGDFVSSLRAAAYDAAMASEEIAVATEKWRTCLEPLGISDLPETPMDMPSPSIGKQFGVGRELSGPPASEEVRIATEDARCRDSSGFSAGLYDQEVERHLDAIAEHEDALERVRAANRRKNERASDIIARYGGA